jgi:hypothetical protein
LDALDKEMVFIDGNLMKPSQCYHIDVEPPHVLFNTNCPDSLREKINDILRKHFPANGNRS